MTLTEIHDEIEQTSERRTELWHILSQGHDPAAAAELKSLSQRLDHLWDEERTLKAELRFGDRSHIVARARVEERLERAAYSNLPPAHPRGMVGPGRGILPSPPGADTFCEDCGCTAARTTTKEP
jgi:hypothetical protein